MQNHNRFIIPLTFVGLLFVGVSIYGFTRIAALEEQVNLLSSGLASTTGAFTAASVAFSQNVSELKTETSGLSKTLSSTKEDIAAATSNLNAVKTQVGGVEQKVGTISGTVSSLQKLSAIDPELLKKYSKVYFLNENYSPNRLALVPQESVYSNTKEERVLAEAMPFLSKLMAKANSDGVVLYVKSAYRSFGEQKTLKSAYSVTYGAGANAFSAEQGYSEHQLGTTIDFITSGFGGQLTEAFDDTQAFAWLANNAHKYGFTLSYPQNNSFYIYEPWHWRFVGVKLSTLVHDRGVNFYDMDQREIDSHLINLFD